MNSHERMLHVQLQAITIFNFIECQFANFAQFVKLLTHEVEWQTTGILNQRDVCTNPFVM